MEKKRKIIPPVYLFLALALMWLLQRYFPVHQYIDTPMAYAGVIPVLFGIAMAAISAGMFVNADTGLEPFDEATTLVTGGFYCITRNPMYLGFMFFLLAWGVLLSNFYSLSLVMVYILYMNYFQIRIEEKALETLLQKGRYQNEMVEC